MRVAEAEVSVPKRLFFFEPSISWAALGLPGPPPFEHDDQVAYSPYIYQGGVNPGNVEDGYARAADEASRDEPSAPNGNTLHVAMARWGVRVAVPGMRCSRWRPSLVPGRR